MIILRYIYARMCSMLATRCKKNYFLTSGFTEFTGAYPTTNTTSSYFIARILSLP